MIITCHLVEEGKKFPLQKCFYDPGISVLSGRDRFRYIQRGRLNLSAGGKFPHSPKFNTSAICNLILHSIFHTRSTVNAPCPKNPQCAPKPPPLPAQPKEHQDMCQTRLSSRVSAAEPRTSGTLARISLITCGPCTNPVLRTGKEKTLVPLPRPLQGPQFHTRNACSICVPASPPFPLPIVDAGNLTPRGTKEDRQTAS